MVKNLPASAFRHNRHGFNPWVGTIPWKRARQPTAVFLPGESHAKKSLVGYGLSVQFSSVAQSSPTLCDPVASSPPGFSVHGFPRQEYWSGLPFPSPGDLPDPEIELMSPALTGGFFTAELPGKPYGFNLWLQVRCKNIDLFFHI